MSQRSKYAARPIPNGSSGAVAQAATVEFKHVEQALNDRLYPSAGMDGTYNAAAFPGATDEAKITRAIAQAVADGVDVVWIPASMLPYDASLVTFDNAVQLVREGGFSPALCYDVMAYGAAGNNSTDDYFAIQACLDACTFVGTHPKRPRVVRFGSAAFLCTTQKPLWVKSAGVRLEGAESGYEQQGLTIANPTFLNIRVNGGPAIYVQGSTATIPDLVTALATGTGSALQMSANRRFNLRHLPTCDLNGLGALCVRFFIKGGASASVGAILSSSGRWLLGDSFPQAFLVKKNATTNVIAVSLTLSGGTVTLTGTTDVATSGAVFHVEVDYNGAIAYLFVDGSLEDSTVASGTVVQNASEDVILGAQTSAAPEVSVLAASAVSIIDSVEIADTARHTAGFTVPTAKHTADSHTRALMNFDDTLGALAKVYVGTATAWVPQYNSALPGVASGFEMVGITVNDNLQGKGIALYFGGTVLSWSLQNVVLNGFRTGFYAMNAGGYDFDLRRCYVNSLKTTDRYGIALNFLCGIGTLSNIWTQGQQVHLYLGATTMLLHRHFAQLDDATIYGMIVYNNSANAAPIEASACAYSTEGGISAAYRGTIAIGGLGSGLNMEASSLELGDIATPLVVHDCTSNPNPHALYKGCFFGRPSTYGSVVKVQGAALGPVMVFEDCQQKSSGIWTPWSNEAGTAIVRAKGKGPAIAFSATPSFDCSLRDEFEITLTANCAPTLDNVTPGQPIKVTIKQDATGGRTWTWPANVKGGGVPSGTASSVSQQCFTADLSSASAPNLYADAPMVVGM